MESSAWLASQSACSSCCSAVVGEGRVMQKEMKIKFLIRRYKGKQREIRNKNDRERDKCKKI